MRPPPRHVAFGAPRTPSGRLGRVVRLWRALLIASGVATSACEAGSASPDEPSPDVAPDVSDDVADAIADARSATPDAAEADARPLGEVEPPRSDDAGTGLEDALADVPGGDAAPGPEDADVAVPDAPSLDADGGPDVDAGAPGEPAPPGLGEVEVYVTPVSSAQVDALVWVGRGASEAWLEREASALRLVRSGLPAPVALPDGLSLAGPLVAAAPSLQDVVVGGDFGLLVLRDGVVLPSPLADRYSGDPVRALLVAPDVQGGAETLWISSASGLWRWQGGVRTPVTAAGIRLAPGLLAGLAPIATEVAFDVPAVWLASEGGLLALHGFPRAPALSLERPDLPTPTVTALGTTRGGLVLALHDAPGAEGRLLIRRHDAGRGVWLTAGAELADPGPVAEAAVHPQASVGWLRTVAGGLVLARDDLSLAAVSPLPTELSGLRALAALPDGRLLAATTAGLFAIAAGHAVSLGDLPSDGRLEAPRAVAIRPTDLASVTSVAATLTPAGGAALELSVRAPDASSRWPTVALDPLALSNGSYSLDVIVTWRDGVTRATSAALIVALPGWSAVEPGLTRMCGGCHASTNAFGRVPLDAPAQVEARVGEILCRADLHQAPRSRVPECAPYGANLPASMPPGPNALAPEVLATLRAWRDAGFRP
jgi:hypothetical protein